VPTNALLDTEVLSREILHIEDYQRLSKKRLTPDDPHSLPQRALVKARATAETLDHILNQNLDIQALWAKTSGHVWSDLQKLSPPFDIVNLVIDLGLDAELEYQEDNQPPIHRWVTPIQMILNGPRRLALVAYCHLDECEKKFSLDHIRGVIQTGQFKVDGEIRWAVTITEVDGQSITELRFEKQRRGEHAGSYHPLFYMMPMIFLSNFIEPKYKLWRAYLGDELIGSNLVFANGRVLSFEEGRKAVDDFSNS
jgi:hypothetical protein